MKERTVSTGGTVRLTIDLARQRLIRLKSYGRLTVKLIDADTSLPAGGFLIVGDAPMTVLVCDEHEGTLKIEYTAPSGNARQKFLNELE